MISDCDGDSIRYCVCDSQVIRARVGSIAFDAYQDCCPAGLRYFVSGVMASGAFELQVLYCTQVLPGSGIASRFRY